MGRETGAEPDPARQRIMTVLRAPPVTEQGGGRTEGAGPARRGSGGEFEVREKRRILEVGASLVRKCIGLDRPRKMPWPSGGALELETRAGGRQFKTHRLPQRQLKPCTTDNVFKLFGEWSK